MSPTVVLLVVTRCLSWLALGGGLSATDVGGDVEYEPIRVPFGSQCSHALTVDLVTPECAGDSSTLWQMSWLAFHVRHPRTTMYKAAVQQQLRVMNMTRQALSAWSTARWYQHGAASTESVLRRALSDIGWEIVDVTAELRQREGRPAFQLPWETWANTVPGADVALYTDTRARQDPDEERGCRVGLVIRVGDKWWGAAVPLETWVDNTTAELLGVVLGRYVVELLRDLGARSIEQAYDAQAAAALAEKPPEQQKHPLRRALQWSVGEAVAAHWWGKIPPRSVSSDESRRCPEDGQHPGGHTGHGSSGQEC